MGPFMVTLFGEWPWRFPEFAGVQSANSPR